MDVVLRLAAHQAFKGGVVARLALGRYERVDVRGPVERLSLLDVVAHGRGVDVVGTGNSRVGQALIVGDEYLSDFVLREAHGSFD